MLFNVIYKSNPLKHLFNLFILTARCGAAGLTHSYYFVLLFLQAHLEVLFCIVFLFCYGWVINSNNMHDGLYSVNDYVSEHSIQTHYKPL